MYKKKSPSEEAVEKVHGVLARFVKWDEVAPRTKPVRYVVHRAAEALGILFADGTWTARGTPDWGGITGIIDGKYNVYATRASEVAAELKLIRIVEHEAFLAWYDKERQKQEDASDVAKMMDIARYHGYEVRKKGSNK